MFHRSLKMLEIGELKTHWLVLHLQIINKHPFYHFIIHGVLLWSAEGLVHAYGLLEAQKVFFSIL